MEPKPSPEEQQKQLITIVVAASVAVIGTLLLLGNKKNKFGVSPYDKVKYGYKAKKAEYKAKSALGSAADSVKGTYKQAKHAVEDALS